ncbi:MAG TPA: adenylosuccinate lyase [Limnochordia bacterium]|jgi:3-carboxy-cis,cis-muconate cycloisomerase|nr:adenylosuccinate lyase [Limnochordia bacterium]
MAVHVIDALLTRDRQGSKEMREIFDEISTIQRWLDVEAALAKAQAKLGIIPEWAAQEISAKAKVEYLDLDKYKERFDRIFNPGVPFIQTFQEACSPEAREFIHVGFATQNIEDTALALQMKQALGVIRAKLESIQGHLVRIAAEHRDTVMAGRTHGQHGTPITFGFKVAAWVSEIRRHIARIDDLASHACVGLAGGPIGTLAFNGEIGLKVMELMMEDLGLAVPEIPVRTVGDHIAEFTFVLGMIGMTLHKIAREIYNLQRSEIDEVQEPFRKGRVGSSSMPHKRNPSMCMNIMRNGRLMAANVPLALEFMSQEHEGEGTVSETAAAFIPETCVLLGGSLNLMENVLSDLVIKPEHMKRNLELTHGMISSETLMKALSEKIGRGQAHHKVFELAMQAYQTQTPFHQVVKADPEVQRYLSAEEIDMSLDPAQGIGLAREFVDRILGSRG